nr:hypothetical protein [Tanacetum cinerariifolium]
MEQNIDFFGSDQIQTPQYPEVHPPSQISDEVFHAKGYLMKSIQTFLEEFNCIPFEEKATILLQSWFKCFAKIAALNSNQEKKEPLQDSDIRKLIREECFIEVCEEQKQNMENTILELVEICHQKELLYMHDNVDDLIESALNSKFLSINSQRLYKKEQEVKNFVEQPAERGNRSIESLQNFRSHPSYQPKKMSIHLVWEHPNTTSKMESDEIIKSGVEELVPILSENEDVEYIEASLSNLEIVSVEEENERLINIVKNDISDDSSNDPLLEEADLFLASGNSISPGIENFVDDSEVDIRFLEELFIDDSIPFPNNESSEFDFDNPSFPRPPSEPPDAETDAGEGISVVMNDELECLDPRDEFDDDDYSSFMFVKVFSFLSAESEDTIFDPGISV